VFDQGVAEDKADVGWKWDGFVMERAAIEKNCVIGFSEAGSELIHDANVRADEFIFGALAELGDFEHWQFVFGLRGKRDCDGNFE
jgi:hypothetical protein